MAASACFPSEGLAQVKYQLFAGPLYVNDDGVTQEYSAYATVLSVPDSSVYDCSGRASKKDNSFRLACNKSNFFNGTLLNGHTVTTQLNRGHDMDVSLVYTGFGFWQLDQTEGNIQFCMFDTRTVGISSSCASTKIGN
ncbi:hypothetical protein [Bradyrhizobium embrapense]